MAVHYTKVKWHDLTEDPNDLPGENVNTYCAPVIELNLCTGEMTHPYEDDLWWNPETQLWESNWEEYGDYGGTNYVRSYGIEPLYRPDPNRRDECYSEDYIVVAWSEGVELYKPRIENISFSGKEVKCDEETDGVPDISGFRKDDL